MSNDQWTVERALREGRADLLMFDTFAVGSIENVSSLFHWVKLKGFCDELSYPVSFRTGENLARLTLRPEKPQPEPDGPPRDWPSIWRQQLREHIERAPMIPREYVQEVLDLIDFCTVKESLPLCMEEDEVKP